MYCSVCGKNNPDGARFCETCGAALANPTPAVKNRSDCAVASLVCSILAVCCTCWSIALSIILSIAAVVLGIIALRSGKNGMAVAGIVIGGISILLVIICAILAVGLFASLITMLTSLF